MSYFLYVNNFTAVEGINTGPFIVATFSDMTGSSGSEYDYMATMLLGGWEDGSSMETLSVVPMGGVGNGTFTFAIMGSHTYQKSTTLGMPHKVNIGFSKKGQAIDSALVIQQGSGNGITVLDAPLTGSGIAINPIIGKKQVNVTLGTFTDANPYSSISDYSGLINWGDGNGAATTAAITLISSAGTSSVVTFGVKATPAYTIAGNNGITIQISDTNGNLVLLFGTEAYVSDPSATSGSGSAPCPSPCATCPTCPTCPESAPCPTCPSPTCPTCPSPCPSSTPTPTPTPCPPCPTPTLCPTVSTSGITQPVINSQSPNMVVATFSGSPSALISDFTALIDWGDSSPKSFGSISQPGGVGKAFSVSGSHQYRSGKYTISVNILSSMAVVKNSVTFPNPRPSPPPRTPTVQTGGLDVIYTRQDIIKAVSGVVNRTSDVINETINDIYGSNRQKFSDRDLSDIVKHLLKSRKQRNR